MPLVPSWYSLPEAAAWLGLSRSGLQRLLQRYADALSPPTYRRVGRHPRRHRILSRRDLMVLHAHQCLHRTWLPRCRRADQGRRRFSW